MAKGEQPPKPKNKSKSKPFQALQEKPFKKVIKKREQRDKKSEVFSVDEKIAETKEKIEKLRKEKEKGNETKAELDKMAKNINDLRNEIEEEKKRQGVVNGDDFDAEAYEAEMLARDDERAKKMADDIDAMQLDGEDKILIKESKDGYEHIKNTWDKKKNIIEKTSESVIGNIIEKKINSTNTNVENTNLEKGKSYDFEIDGDEIKESNDDSKEVKNEEVEKTEILDGINTRELKKYEINHIIDVTEEKTEETKNINKEGKNNNEDLGLRLEEILANKEKATLAKLNESKFRSTTLKTIGAVENFGKNETGPKGLAKRLTKMGINLALIGLISSVAVDQLAEAGYGSATALSGGVFSKLAVKMGIGLGIGASTELGGNKIPSKVRKFIPYIMGGVGVTAAIVLSGGMAAGVAAGASFGLGLASQKWVKGRFTDEKIETKRADKIKEFYQKIEKEGFDFNKSKKYEDEFEKIIKKYENQKIWGKLLDGATKLTVGTLISGFALEASGIARDFTQGDTFTEVVTEEKAEVVTEEKAEVVTEEKAEVVTEEKAELVKVMSETKNPEIKIVSVEANDGQGAISTLHELQKSLREEYQNVVKLPASIDHIINTDARELSKEYGLYKPGEEAESAKVFVGDKMSFNKETGEVVFTHARGGEDILQKGLEYKGDMFDSANKETEITNDDSKEVTHDFVKNNLQVPPEVAVNGEDVTGNLKPDIPKEELYNNEVSKTINDLNNEEAQGGGEQETAKEPEPQSDSRDLSPREIRQMDRVFDKNLNHLFPEDKDVNVWNDIKGSSAADLYYGDSFNNLDPQHESLHSYLHKIHEVTGIEPIEGNLIQSAETNLEFIERGLKEAVLIGKLDEVKL
jgi:hypothetical protein